MRSDWRARPRRVLGGGVRFGARPFADSRSSSTGKRNLSREFSPSATAIVNSTAIAATAISLGALGKLRSTASRAVQAATNREPKAELGALFVSSAPWYLDANAIAGRGMGDDGEMDAERRLRSDAMVGSHVRLGFDGQLRARVAGRVPFRTAHLGFRRGSTGNHWPGPLLRLDDGRPATTGLVSRNVGWIAMLSGRRRAF